MGSTIPFYDVLLVGGGFSGCYLLHTLRQNGFQTHLVEAGSALGGIWYWNCYPGARVDTAVPCYQLTSPDSWAEWNWSQRFPGRDELEDYFRHLDKTWALSERGDVSFESRVTAMRWVEDANGKRWVARVEKTGGGEVEVHAKTVVLCTGFASKPYAPPFKNLDMFRGEIHHTSRWPQSGVNLAGRRVAVIGTGASGVQVIQEIGKVAGHLTVFQRTPNTALPMENPSVDAAENDAMKATFADVKAKIVKTFAGFDYEFVPGEAMKASKEERMALYEKLYSTGGLHFWLGTYKDVLFEQLPNDEAYAFWRAKTLPRIESRRVAEILAPETPPHPFGTKRISLEQKYFEVFNQENVDLVSLKENLIEEFVPEGIKTRDGIVREFDVVVLATGFDSITGGITQIDIQGLKQGVSIKDKWSQGVYTQLGMTVSGFPNLFFTYGPQAPTAFATGPSNAEVQGDWIVGCLKHMQREGYTSINATREAEQEWRKHVHEIAEKGLFPQADSWYFGANIPGKPREALNYMAGLPIYKQKCWDSANEGYKGFVLTKG